MRLIINWFGTKVFKSMAFLQLGQVLPLFIQSPIANLSKVWPH